MKILIMGGAGMIGQKLLNLLLKKEKLNNQKISEITLFDIIEAPYYNNIKNYSALKKSVVKFNPDIIFHLAAIVSGQAEQEFDLGWDINAKGSWGLFEAIRHQGENYCPRLVFTSSIAVFGAPFPDKIPDDFFTTPLTSYGAQKAISELLLADYSRKKMIDGVSIRLPTICVRPGKPNLAASGFFSGIILTQYKKLISKLKQKKKINMMFIFKVIKN